MPNLLILGAAGHGRSVLDCALSMEIFHQIAFAADYGAKKIHGYPLVGTFADVEKLRKDYDTAVVAVGNNQFRLGMTQKLKELGYQLMPMIHKTAYVSPLAIIGDGSVILANSSVNTDTIIGEACIINTSASIDHDCRLGDAVHFSPNSVACGFVSVGKCTWIGAGATLIDHLTVGEDVTVGAGAVVLNDVKNKTVVYGVPAKEKGESIK